MYSSTDLNNDSCLGVTKATGWPLWVGLSPTRKNIYNLIGWEEYNIGRICTVFGIFTLLLNKKNQHSISVAEK